MLEKEQIQILMRLHELEQSLAAMYALFAEKFPAHRDLWKILVKEENEHAEAVRELYQGTYQHTVFFDEGAVRLNAIEAIIDFVTQYCEMARLDTMTAGKALEVSRDIEKSVIAKNIFDHFEVDREFTSKLRYLRDSSEKHAGLVQIEIDKCNKAIGDTGV